MNVIALDQTVRDQWLKSQYIRTLRPMISCPLVMTKIEASLTPEKIALCRDDMEAIVRGERVTSLRRA